MLTESVSLLPGFTSYFSFSRRRTGYSGVATFCRSNVTPVQAEEGIAGSLGCPGDSLDFDLHASESSLSNICAEFSLEARRALDNEGRCVITRHQIGEGKFLSIFNLYCPRADPEREDRVRFKLQFYRALDLRAAALRERGDSVIVLGDINTSHREEDHCEPYLGFRDRSDRRFLEHFILTPGEQQNQEKSSEKEEDSGICNESAEENKETEEFSNDCEWQGNFKLPSHQFVDSFRFLHPEVRQVFTCWNTEKGCRATNYGTRIDYIFSSLDIRTKLVSCEVLGEVEGSDHCPVLASFDLSVQPPVKPPKMATLYFPEFSGR